MFPALAFLAVAAATPNEQLTTWMDRIAQAQLDARDRSIAAITTRAQAEARSRETRAKILGLIGGMPADQGPLNARTVGSIDAGSYRIERVVFESLPRYFVTGNLYMPKAPGKHPGILYALGHWDQGKPIAQVLAGNLALRGFAVFAYDPVGQGERLQAWDARTGKSLGGGSVEQHLLSGAQSTLIGQSFARYRIYDAKRALDYLLSRPEVDRLRVGCTGCSGGGTVATYISALDDRIKVAVPSCYMNSFRKLFSGPTGDSEQSIPNFLAAGLDLTDYVEMFAPKPWLITSTENDFFTPAGARIVYEEARRWYGLFGATDRIEWVVGPGGHGTPREVREKIYAWFMRWLDPEHAGSAAEQPIEPRPAHELQVGKVGQVAADFHSRELFEVIRDQAPSAKRPPALAELVAHRPPANVRRGEDGAISFDVDAGLTLEARLLGARPGPKRAATLIVQMRPQPSPGIRERADAGELLLVVAPRGLPGPSTDRMSGDWITNTRALLIGRVLPAMRAHDILCALDVLAAQPEVDATQIDASADDVAGEWLLMAAALDRRIRSVTLNHTPYRLRDALNVPLTHSLFDAAIPGVLASWDFDVLEKQIAPRKVTWVDPMDWMRNPIARPGARYTTPTQ